MDYKNFLVLNASKIFAFKNNIEKEKIGQLQTLLKQINELYEFEPFEDLIKLNHEQIIRDIAKYHHDINRNIEYLFDVDENIICPYNIIGKLSFQKEFDCFDFIISFTIICRRGYAKEYNFDYLIEHEIINAQYTHVKLMDIKLKKYPKTSSWVEFAERQMKFDIEKVTSNVALYLFTFFLFF